ncbi:uncharacterized protein LOC120526940 isoform X2 [Polypterus senegalus]|uniref:uncharacterized protein LOC120526940 isoform X2 n=1 Tax=Polypterus senegalus TaxID=55291 RepID=UPI001966B53E|nr:uncharacterized protein LOC120526940 isoform X2 [Polypterus senegalus]
MGCDQSKTVAEQSHGQQSPDIQRSGSPVCSCCADCSSMGQDATQVEDEEGRSQSPKKAPLNIKVKVSGKRETDEIVDDYGGVPVAIPVKGRTTPGGEGHAEIGGRVKDGRHSEGGKSWKEQEPSVKEAEEGQALEEQPPNKEYFLESRAAPSAPSSVGTPDVDSQPSVASYAFEPELSHVPSADSAEGEGAARSPASDGYLEDDDDDELFESELDFCSSSFSKGSTSLEEGDRLAGSALHKRRYRNANEWKKKVTLDTEREVRLEREANVAVLKALVHRCILIKKHLLDKETLSDLQ